MWIASKTEEIRPLRIEYIEADLGYYIYERDEIR